MNRTKLTLVMVALSLLIAAPLANAAHAGDKYAGAQYANLTYDESGFDTLNPKALVGRLGTYLNDSFAVEVRAGVGIADDTITASGTEITLDLDTIFGVYGVGHLPMGKTSSIYALVGYTSAGLSAKSSAGGSASDTDSSLSFGVGAQFDVTNSVSINAEYTSYLNTSDYDINAISVGVNIGF